MRSARQQPPEITLRLALPLFIPELIYRFNSRVDELVKKVSSVDFASYQNKLKFSRRDFPLRNRLPIILLGLGVVVVAVAGFVIFRRATTASADTRVTVMAAKASEILNKDIFVPIKDANGKEVTKAKFNFDSAELRDEIIVNGQKAEAVKGRTFLILNIKITNPYDQPLVLNVRDFVRLSVNGDDQDWLAADIHNDPVNVRPASTKITRLGFPINDTDKKLVLKLGGVDGDKATVNLKLK